MSPSFHERGTRREKQSRRRRILHLLFYLQLLYPSSNPVFCASHKLAQRNIVLLTSISHTQRDLFSLHLVVTDHKHVRHFLVLCIPDLGIHAFRSLIQFYPDSFSAKFFSNFTSIVKMTICN